MKVHKWENRLLIIEADQADNPLFIKQLSDLELAEKQLYERKIIIYTLVNSTYKKISFSPDKNTISLNEAPKLPFPKRLSAESFRISLVGLDGGLKLQQITPLTLEKLCNKIDAMPMRASELRKN